jgi:hypothetical protein
LTGIPSLGDWQVCHHLNALLRGHIRRSLRQSIPKTVISAQFVLVLIFFIQIRTEFRQPGSHLSALILSLISLAVLVAVAGLFYRSRIARLVASILLIYVAVRGFYLFHGMYQLIKPMDLIEWLVFGTLNLAHAFCIYLAAALFLGPSAKLYFGMSA